LRSPRYTVAPERSLPAGWDALEEFRFWRVRKENHKTITSRTRTTHPIGFIVADILTRTILGENIAIALIDHVASKIQDLSHQTTGAHSTVLFLRSSDAYFEPLLLAFIFRRFQQHEAD